VKDCLLIVEDEIDLLNGLKRTIAMEIDCEVIGTENGKEALDIIRKKPVDLVLTDIKMPEMNGMTLLQEVRKVDPAITVIMMTGFGTIELAVKAIKAGAYDFIKKPFDETALVHQIEKGLERNRLVRENARLLKQAGVGNQCVGMVGKCARAGKLFEAIRMMASTDVSVLLLGESGTGKEMAARGIHSLGKRQKKSMVVVNCPALPEAILESELFGYKKGAFTNAVSNKKGLFEEAHGSTIFLDEIGDISLSVQTKLLRVLQEKEVKPLGENRTRHVDVRVIASTNQDLRQKIKDGSFREDLFYRLNVATLVLPTLKERIEDLPLLVNHFLEKAAITLSVKKKEISTEALNTLLSREWPGNIRELENLIMSLTAMTPEDRIEKRHLDTNAPQDVAATVSMDFNKSYKDLKEQALSDFTTRYTTGLLKKTMGNVSRAAQISGIKRQSLQKILRRYHIDPEIFRT
jgi:DNA-binding NtrC family response regulator